MTGMIQMQAEWLVGGLAIAMASLLSWNALSFSPLFYQLGTVSAVQSRFGRKAACGFLLGVSVVLLAAGVTILSGTRPAYAVPSPVGDAESE
jgi:hypothetical protein